jgi:LmbE family N-acetylglucosaminyl deacetylase
MPKNKPKIYALVVIAHPDDESYLIAGTSLKLNAEGKQLVVVCATRGEQGNSQLTEPMTKRQLAKVREQELRLSCAMLKVKEVDFFNFPDGGLKLAPQADIVSAVIKKIDYYQPEVVITFGKEGITGHSDHITIGEATVKAAKKSKHRPKQIWRLSLPQSIIKDFEDMITKSRAHKTHYRRSLLKGVPDKKLLWMNIKKYKKQKMEAICSHKSQGLPHWVRHQSPTMEKVFMSSEFFEVIKI